MKPGRRWFLWLAGLALAASVALAAQTWRIRLATLVPDNSPWTNALRSMDASLKKATDGRVGVQVFAAAAQTEDLILNRIALNGFDAATLMIAGLGSIDESVNVFGMPFFFESDAEYQYVQKQLTPLIAQRFAARKFRLVNWGNGGWVRLFSKVPLRTLSDIKAARLYTTAGDQKSLNWYLRNGFHAVPLQTSQIVGALAAPAGPINASPSPPVYAAPLQLHRYAKYMLDIPLGPLTAATVISERAWSRLSENDRARLLEVGAATESVVNAAAPSLDQRYIDEMKKAGLEVVPVDAKNLAEFRAEAERLALTQRGDLVPADIFDAAMRERAAFRKMKK